MRGLIYIPVCLYIYIYACLYVGFIYIYTLIHDVTPSPFWLKFYLSTFWPIGVNFSPPTHNLTKLILFEGLKIGRIS